MVKAALLPWPTRLLQASLAQGAPKSILLLGSRSPPPPRPSLSERETAWVCELQLKCRLLLPSPLLPPSSSASLWPERQQHWRSSLDVRLRKPPPPSPSDTPPPSWLSTSQPLKPDREPFLPVGAKAEQRKRGRLQPGTKWPSL